MSNMQLFSFVEPGTPLWHWLRKNRYFITGSNVANVMGIGYQSRKAYFEEVVLGKKKPASEFLIEAMKHGTDTEPKAYEDFMQKIFKKSEKTWSHVYSPGIYNWAEHPEVGFSPDLVLLDKKGRESVYVEIKCPFVGNWWERHRDEIFVKKPQYYVQIQMGIAATGAEEGWLYIYIPVSKEESLEGMFTQRRLIRIKRDDDFINFCYDYIEKWKEIVDSGDVKNAKLKRGEKGEVMDRLLASFYNSVID